MFDKMLVSTSNGEGFARRSKFFVVSTAIVGTLFAAAVVASIYAADIDLGADDFYEIRLLAPEVAEAPKAEQPQQAASTATSQQDKPTRTDNVARLEEHQPTPDQISVAKSNVMARPDGYFEISNVNYQPNQDIGPIGRESGISGVTGTPTEGSDRDGTETARTRVPPPPPVKKADPPVAESKNLGVVNGIAIDLPKPPYPQTARALGLQDDVNVQITIDETGRVVSARAISGNILFRDAAVQAAKRAKFDPTLLSGKPVKATGVIIYRFRKN